MKHKKAKRFIVLLLFAALLWTAVYWCARDAAKAAAEKTGATLPFLPNVPYINQRMDYPTGCESVSAVMALQYAGVDITVDTFIDDCLDTGERPAYEDGVRYGCDPWEAFPGDPRSSSGYGCFSPVIERALRRAVGTQPYTVESLNGLTLDELCGRYVQKGVPVIVWATIDMAAPKPGSTWIVRDTGRLIQWMTPMHCLLLVGYDEKSYYFNDPWREAAVAYPRGDCTVAYDGFGRQAVVVYASAAQSSTSTIDGR